MRSAPHPSLLVMAAALSACAAEVRVVEGGDGGGGSLGTGGTTESVTGAGGGSPSVAAQIREACRTMCLSGCGVASGCTDACVASFPTTLPECADEATALLGCLTKTGDTLECPSTDRECADPSFAYHLCQNPLLCGTWGDPPQCGSGDGPGCACTQGCDDGHLAGAACTYDFEDEIETCECSFDGVVVGQCQNALDSHCGIYSSVCCAPFWR